MNTFLRAAALFISSSMLMGCSAPTGAGTSIPGPEATPQASSVAPKPSAEATRVGPSSDLTPGAPVAAVGKLNLEKDDLLRALTFFSPEEANGGDIDYEYVWSGTQRGAAGLARSAKASNRDRDFLSLAIYSPDLTVDMDGTVTFTMIFKLNSHEDRVKALCNGLVVEVAEHYFIIPPFESCSSGEYLYSDYDMMPYGIYSEVDWNKIALMATNPFVIRAVDIDGVEHVFDFDEKSTLESEPGCDGSSSITKCSLSAQDILTLALQARQAVEDGLGY